MHELLQNVCVDDGCLLRCRSVHACLLLVVSEIPSEALRQREPINKEFCVHYSLLILCLLFCLLYLLNFVFVAPLCLIHSSLRHLLNQGLGLVRLSLLTVVSWNCSNSARPALDSLLDIG